MSALTTERQIRPTGRAIWAAASLLALTACTSTPLNPHANVDQAQAGASAMQADQDAAERQPQAVRKAELAESNVAGLLPSVESRLRGHRAEIAEVDARRMQSRSDAETTKLENQITALQAETTDRGLVMTLGDPLFADGHAMLKSDAHPPLDRLVEFLKHHPQRRVDIEGHTDNVGSGDYNHGLSRRRAESVRTYLTGHGIHSARLSALGLGADRPIASNQTLIGREQNRRVEVVIEDPR